MAELQTITAAWSIAHLAWDAAQLIRRVCTGAQIEANILYRKTHDVGCLADNIKKVVDARKQHRRGSPISALENSIHESIKDSLKECENSLRFINKQLQPFDGSEDTSVLERLARNWRFIRTKAFCTAQESIIESRLQSLSLSINLLSSYDLYSGNLPRLEAVRDLDQSIQRYANSRQEDLASKLVDRVPELEGSSSGCSPDCDHCRSLQSDSDIIVAVKKNDAASIQKFLDAGVSIYVTGAEDKTPLHHAAANPNFGVLALLLGESEAWDPLFLNLQSSDGRTALMVAAEHSYDKLNLDFANQIIERGGNVHMTDNQNRSAMYWAIDGLTLPNRVNFVRLLCYYHADFEAMKKRHPRKYDDFKIHIDQTRRRNSVFSIPTTDEDIEGTELARFQTMPAPSPTSGRRRSSFAFSFRPFRRFSTS